VPWLAVSGVAQLAVAVPTLGWVAYGLALTGLWTSWVPRREVVRIQLESVSPPSAGEPVSDAAPTRDVRRVRVERSRVSELPSAVVPGALRVVQITDPHLGAFRSEASLRALCARVVAADPDLVLLTGDYYTMEGAGTPDALGRALAPLRALEGRTFACLGNHDHEAPEAVARGLAEAGVELLVDRGVLVETRRGPVQVVGLDHRWTRARPPQALAPGPQEGPSGHAAVLAACPRPAGVPRIVLLHDPSAFKHLPEGEADLVLSGHTHGGHVGLVSLGLDWTVIGGLSGMPDHGAWARGRDRLYVHRASGHYGFPLRLGVPMEESVLEVVHPAFARHEGMGARATG
jgi:predicted MPP superfamily phosphohydrolase